MPAMVGISGGKPPRVVLAGVALVFAGLVALGGPARAQESATIEQMRARDVLAAPAGELAAWEAFAAAIAADAAAAPELVAESRLGLAIALLYTADKERGWREWQAADAIIANLPAPPPFMARHQAYGAMLATERGEVAEAERLARAALAATRSPAEEALALNAMGGIAFARNDLPGAESAYCAARDRGLADPAPYHAMVVNDASSCAAVKYYLERPDTLAAMRLASDHAAAHLPPDHPKMGNVLNSAYAILLRYGRYAEAEPLIRRHLELERRLRPGDAEEIYDPLSLLGRALELRGRFDDAEEVFRAAADMADRLRSPAQPWARGRARSNLAAVIARQGRFADAEAEARAGVERLVADLDPANSNIGSGRVAWADHLARLGRHDEALREVEAGLALLRADYAEDHSEVLAARLVQARVLAGLGRAGEGLAQARAASALFETRMLDLAASETDRVALSRVLPRGFADYLAVALAAASAEDLARGAQLYLLSDLGVSNARIAAAALAREEGLGAAVDRLDRAREAVTAAETASRAALAAGTPGGAETAALAAAQAEALAAQAALLAAFPRYADLARPRVLSLAELQDRLGEGELLVLPMSLPDGAVTLAISREGVHWAQVAVDPLTLSHRAEALRASAESPGAFDVAAAQAMFATVFPAALRPVLDRARSLLFPASGYLARLSPAVLLAGEADPARLAQAPWLVRSHGVRVVADLAALGRTQAPLSARAFLGVGAPQALPPALLSMGEGAGLPPLPRAQAELQQLADALGSPARTLLAGGQASEARLAGLDLASFGVIAFATHGLAGGEVAGLDEPALLLAAGEGGDGLLTASEIARMRLAADWVILSACNTASGEGAGAPSYSGLARAFAAAGARSLMLSHWRVRDDAAAFLTVETLRRAAAGASRAEALRQAQLALIARADLPQAAHPALWAPFVILEN